MKRRILVRHLVLFFFVSLPIFAISAGDSKAVKNDSLDHRRLQAGGMPVLAYDADVGLRYGIVLNLFDFGKPSQFPDHLRYIKLTTFRSTGGSSHLSLLYEGSGGSMLSLFSFEFTLVKDTKFDFFGFNGNNTLYNPGFIDPENSDYLNKYYYAHARVLFRLRADVHRSLRSERWKLFCGVNLSAITVDDLDYGGLKPAAGGDGSNPEEVSLYQHYVDWGLISPGEQHGGRSLSLQTGVSYDTRNHKIHCTDGIWFENFLVGNISLNQQNTFAKLITTFRYYNHIAPLSSVVMVRFSSQQKLWGSIPFYLLPQFYDTRQNQDGLGGAFTLRGIYRSRISADGFLLVNAEIRKDIAALTLLRQSGVLSLSLFSDMGYLSQPYALPVHSMPTEVQHVYLKQEAQKPHFTLGLGGYLVYNENNVVSVNIGYTRNIQMGGLSLYVGSAFLF